MDKVTMYKNCGKVQSFQDVKHRFLTDEDAKSMAFVPTCRKLAWDEKKKAFEVSERKAV